MLKRKPLPHREFNAITRSYFCVLNASTQRANKINRNSEILVTMNSKFHVFKFLLHLNDVLTNFALSKLPGSSMIPVRLHHAITNEVWPRGLPSLFTHQVVSTDSLATIHLPRDLQIRGFLFYLGGLEGLLTRSELVLLSGAQVCKEEDTIGELFDRVAPRASFLHLTYLVRSVAERSEMKERVARMLNVEPELVKETIRSALSSASCGGTGVARRIESVCQESGLFI